MQTTKVGIREFREHLSDYLESKTPVAITRHGSTIGIYVTGIRHDLLNRLPEDNLPIAPPVVKYCHLREFRGG